MWAVSAYVENSPPIYRSAAHSMVMIHDSIAVERVLRLEEERRRGWCEPCPLMLNPIEFFADRDLRSLTIEGLMTMLIFSSTA